MDKSKAIYNYLSDINCCNVCILRFLRGRGNDFLNITSSFKSLGIDVPTEESNEESDEIYSEPKRKKSNICIACLGLFDKDNLETTISKIIADPVRNSYDINEFLTSISLPIIMHFNQLLIWIHLIDKFPDFDFSDDEPPDTPAKEVARIIINSRISKIINKPITQEGLMINIFYEVSDESQIKKLEELCPDLFQQKNQQKRRREYMTRNYFEKNFIPRNIDFDVIKDGIEFPFLPTECLKLDKITFTGPTVFLAGRYNKYSRELCQTPWMLNGRKVMEDSVQEIIVKEIASYFCVPENSPKFSSSGREDVDVRCLGKGRPFVLEIMDSKKDILPDQIAFEMECKINKSDKVAVRDLQLVPRSELTILKSGEEEKQKCYRALCILNKPVTLEILEKLDQPEGFMIQQLTPLRVLHRRPLHSRPRRIHKLKAYAVKSNEKLIIIDVVTQAGSYIKELVHGDFGRTQPSISSIINDFIDIISLDVTSIELNWPKEIIRNSTEKI